MASHLQTNSQPLFGQSLEDLCALAQQLTLPKYRATQLHQALYKQRVQSLEEITTLPIEVRTLLSTQNYEVGLPQIVQSAKSIDGTERYLIRLADGQTVETVWMPGGDGGERGDGSEAALEESRDDETPTQDTYKRATICISSQVGCAVNCQFCLTAKLGITRNLTPGEIAGQVAAVLNRQRVRIGSGKGVDTPSRINLVFMGMGEPFLNYEAFMQSVHLLRAMGIPESRMTVSTSGILPGILQFAQEPIRPKLALSLNASNDTTRAEIMPITRKWNIAALLDALDQIPLGKREYVTFEYVLLGGINDQPTHAREVLALLAGRKAKVNLIVWNPGPGIDYTQPAPEDVAIFHRMLIDGGIPTFTRRPRGRDIFAACGQLKRTLDTAAPSLVAIAPAEPPQTHRPTVSS
ncbi:MAG TPA: 23S rRNA (adenine(2503)-C(2))-methyltransferase RlmN [Acidobacteriaceae bacterium]|nr:23S rRNA (adenine(2503)-C(2))-methyltransferase RlmN [Acidobacteriaceae bacterium]